jgi:two-component system cell cycle sensor histidine kinase/response regulator CckA
LLESVRSLREVLLRIFGKDITVEIVPAVEPVQAEFDQAQIEQVIVNLAQNARAAMPAGGQFRLQAENVTLEEEAARSVPEGRPGRFARLTATDTGIGMDAPTLARIFEPFFGTDLERTGLGLSVAYGIVKQHGGWINVHSMPGQGTTFWIYLPALDGQANFDGNIPGHSSSGAE